MKTETFYIKRGNTRPVMQYTLEPPTDLTGASVVLNMRRRGGDIVVSGAAVSIVSPPTAGTVQYIFTAQDTATAGIHEVEFDVTYPDGGFETFPNKGYIEILIDHDIS